MGVKIWAQNGSDWPQMGFVATCDPNLVTLNYINKLGNEQLDLLEYITAILLNTYKQEGYTF